MLDIIKEDILAVLGDAVKTLKTEEYPVTALSELSNHVIHDASIFQDDDSVSVAVLVHALAKTVQQCCEKDMSYAHLVKQLEKAYDLLSRNDFKSYRTAIREFLNQLRQINEKIGIYIQEVLDRAKIKKGSKMHEHGISTARTAEILGITQWELQDFIGKQKEWVIKEMPARQRLKIAKEMFR